MRHGPRFVLAAVDRGDRAFEVEHHVEPLRAVVLGRRVAGCDPADRGDRRDRGRQLLACALVRLAADEALRGGGGCRLKARPDRPARSWPRRCDQRCSPCPIDGREGGAAPALARWRGWAGCCGSAPPPPRHGLLPPRTGSASARPGRQIGDAVLAVRHHHLEYHPGPSCVRSWRSATRMASLEVDQAVGGEPSRPSQQSA